jgi:hypothetical protein
MSFSGWRRAGREHDRAEIHHDAHPGTGAAGYRRLRHRGRSRAWNYLHQAVGGFFAVVIGGNSHLILTAWRSIENDRAQREMLRVVIKGASLKRWERMPEAPADLLWVLGRADSLSNVRNDAIHALVSFRIGPEITVGVALPARGKREKRLWDEATKGKKLLDEFAKCEQDTDALSVFVQRATFALADPDRQEWPTPRPKQTWVSPKPAKATKPKRAKR